MPFSLSGKLERLGSFCKYSSQIVDHDIDGYSCLIWREVMVRVALMTGLAETSLDCKDRHG
jgi:hypothetical protein